MFIIEYLCDLLSLEPVGVIVYGLFLIFCLYNVFILEIGRLSNNKLRSK